MPSATPVGPLDLLGWTALLVLCQTTFLAAAVWMWFRRRRSSPTRRHRLAMMCLVAAVVLVPSTLALLGHPSPRASAQRVHARVAATLPAPQSVRMAPTSEGIGEPPQGSAGTDERAHRSVPSIARLALSGLGALWLFGTSLLLARLGGGLLVVRHIRQHAARPKQHLDERISSLADRIGLRRPVEVLQSAGVEAPAVTGWRRAVLILPDSLCRKMDSTELEPVLLHELEHVRRNDQMTSLVLGLAEALLFFSPGARWLSARARLEREHCCDDAAVCATGDPAAFARALGKLVHLDGSGSPAVAAGVGAPRLSDRIRRVLEGEQPPTLKAWQAVGAGAALLTTVATGLVLLHASLALTAPAVGSVSQAVHGTDEYDPLEPGRTWTYRLTSNGRDEAMTVRSLPVRELHGHQVSVREETLEGFPVAAGIAYAFVSREERATCTVALQPIFASEATRPDPPSCRPVGWSQVGATWREPAIIHQGRVSGFIARTESVEAVVDVPAGTFTRAVRVRRQPVTALNLPAASEGFRWVTWHAPGVGLIKSVFNGTAPSGDVVEKSLELVAWGTDPPRPSLDDATPLAVVTAFYEAVGQGHLREAEACLTPASLERIRLSLGSLRGFQIFCQRRGGAGALRDVQVTEEAVSADRADLWVLRTYENGVRLSEESLVKTPRGWRILIAEVDAAGVPNDSAAE